MIVLKIIMPISSLLLAFAGIVATKPIKNVTIAYRQLRDELGVSIACQPVTTFCSDGNVVPCTTILIGGEVQFGASVYALQSELNPNQCEYRIRKDVN